MTDATTAATEAFAAELAATGVPARAAFAAAVVLDLPVADALNVLLAAGTVQFVFVRRPADLVNGEALTVRMAGAG